MNSDKIKEGPEIEEKVLSYLGSCLFKPSNDEFFYLKEAIKRTREECQKENVIEMKKAFEQGIQYSNNIWMAKMLNKETEFQDKIKKFEIFLDEKNNQMKEHIKQFGIDNNRDIDIREKGIMIIIPTLYKNKFKQIFGEEQK